MESHLVVLDCDNTMGPWAKEIDDGLALLYLLGRSDVRLVGITTTFGNGPLDLVCDQTQWLLGRVGRQDIPVYRGAEGRPGGVTPAANFLVQVARDLPGEVTILAIGPLSNLATACEVDPGFLDRVNRVVCMGGVAETLRIGWREVAELNLSADPEAAHRILGNTACPVALMNAEICLGAAFGLGDLAMLHTWPRDLRQIVRKWLLAFGLRCGVPRFYLWDLVPAVYITNPELYPSHPVALKSTVRDLGTGQLVTAPCDDHTALQMPDRILDVGRFKQLLVEAWDRVVR